MEYPLLGSIRNPEDLKKLKIDQMHELSKEIRDFILHNISQTGGHLASNLGVVELTLALHYVFESPQDKFVWDVGHQSYIHKILTGRRDMFDTLRQFGGLSGFPKPNESIHDSFGTGHSSTSISAALGIARARDIKGQANNKVIAIIGDGALTGGMAFEALNDAGHSDTDLIVILNDNEMSISKNVGALSGHLSKVRTSSEYNWLKNGVQNLLDKIPWVGKPISRGIELVKRGFKSLLVHGMVFEEMGFKYLGPIDGHNINSLVSVLKQASKMNGPILIHAITQKGRGYTFAEENPELFHGVSPFNLETGIIKSKETKTFSNSFGNKLAEMAEVDNRIVAITAAMLESTGLAKFKERFPHRFFDVGIAEQHAVTMAAGFASSGLRPYVAIYSTFLQRAYDQILHDVCLQNLPVRFAIDRAGFVGGDGETHHGVFDISFLNHMPNMTIFAPQNPKELRELLDLTISIDGPVAIRYPKGFVDISLIPAYNARPIIDPFTWRTIVDGRDCCILSFGEMLNVSIRVANILSKVGISVQVVNAGCIKPLDIRTLKTLAKNQTHWITLEDNVITGGFGSAVNQYVIQQDYGVSIMNLGIPDNFIPQGSTKQLLEFISLDPNSIATKIKSFIKNVKENIYVQSL